MKEILKENLKYTKLWFIILYYINQLKGNFAKKNFFYMFFLMYKYECLYVY